MKNLISLGELCNKITDGTHHTPTYKVEGVPFLRVTDITQSNDSKKYISEAEHLELIKRCNPEKGDILYTKNGTIGVAKKISWDYEFSIFVSLCLLKPNTQLVFTDYLVHYLNTKMALNQALSHTKTGTISNLHLIEIKKIKIPLPPLPQQQKIATILDAADAVRKNDKALIEKYDELTQALFLDMFGDPVSNPKGWEKVELKKLLENVKKITKDCRLLTIKYVDISSIDNKNFQITSTTDYKIEDRPSRAQQILKTGDILLSTVRPNLKNIAINCIDGYIASTGFSVCRTNDKLSNRYLFETLKSDSVTNYFVGITAGANYPAIKTSDVNKFMLALPPIILQNQFAERITLIEEQKAISQKSLERSEELFNSLLQKAFKGELI
ncbi:MAG: type I restriction enzyme S subunit [Marivirga sp.]|jgi:type I restriction enzyme S subunit